MLRPVIVRQGELFTPRYVDLLVKQLAPHKPLLLTDRSYIDGTDAIELRDQLPGWWSKMELFAPWNEELRPFVFFDLDTYVLDNIDDILSDSGERLLMLRDFYQPTNPASGMMIVPKNTEYIWDCWMHDPMGHMSRFIGAGDQGFLGVFNQGFLQDTYDGISSYKVHGKEKPGGRIVCFHGRPKPHETDGWAGDIWRAI